MTTFYDFLAQNSPTLQTRKALILIGLQYEFVTPGYPLCAKLTDDYVDKITTLVTAFRPYVDIIWVRSEYDPAIQQAHGEIDDWSTITQVDTDRSATELDDELFLNLKTREVQPCLVGSQSAAFVPRIEALIQPQDRVLIKHQYSAFTATSLLLTLRSRLITKVYICGALSNISAYATAIDSARNGMETVLLEDCLAYRHIDRHEAALSRLQEWSVAKVCSSQKAFHRLQNPDQDAAMNQREQSCEDDHDTEDFLDDLDQEIGQLEVDDDISEDEIHLFNPSRYRQTHSTDNISVQEGRAASRIPNGSTTFHDVQSYLRTSINNANLDNYARRQHDSSGIASKKFKRYNDSDTTPMQNLLVTRRQADMQHVQDTQQMTSGEIDQDRTPLFGTDKVVESAGSTITYNLLPSAESSFDKVKTEVKWERMLHQTGEVPRLVCCQGSVSNDGISPIYRHPSDKTMTVQSWSPSINDIRLAAEKVVGHELNHALIQLYRNGKDFISEHSDKTLDIVAGSTIVNVSLGAERVMRLRSKRSAHNDNARTTYRVRLPHNSMISMTLATNAEYLHGINADKRPACELLESETAFAGQRISVTFRLIGTYLNADSTLIWGQGAIGKSRADALPVIVGDCDESRDLIKAFGCENQNSTIDWDVWYGNGSNVLHLK